MELMVISSDEVKVERISWTRVFRVPACCSRKQVAPVFD